MKSFFIKFASQFSIATLFLLGCTTTKTGIAETDNNVSTLVKAKQYTFVATSVEPTEDAQYNLRTMIPNGSNMYQLTSRYDVRVTPDSVVAYLPFFGKAYTAPINPTEGGIKFISTKFTYTQSMRKKMYEIEIAPKDVQDIQKIYFSISPSGFSSLRVLSINKSPIAYNGNIEANK
jgi:hypothetical protein